MYLADGRVEIDNNRVENAIHPTAVGKRNWLFMGEAGAWQRGASLFTIIESCRRRRLDPYAHLKDILTRLPAMMNRQLPEVPPYWAKAPSLSKKSLRKLHSLRLLNPCIQPVLRVSLTLKATWWFTGRCFPWLRRSL